MDSKTFREMLQHQRDTLESLATADAGATEAVHVLIGVHLADTIQYAAELIADRLDRLPGGGS